MNWRFKSLGSLLEVCSEISRLDIRLDALLAGYESPGAHERAPGCRYLLRETETQCELLRDGESCYHAKDCDDVLDFFQMDLYRCIVAQVRTRWLLHAAALAHGNRVLVLAGPSDAGKSTLCRALMRNGWAYLSEEIVSLGPSDVDALRRPLHLEAPEQLAGIPVPLHPVLMRDEPVSWIAGPPPVPAALRWENLRVAAIVRVQYRPGQETELRALKASAALEQLWDCRMNTGIDVAQTACAVVANTPCYRLDTADVESALSAITSIELE